MNTHFSGHRGAHLWLPAIILLAGLWLPGAAAGDAMTLEFPVLPQAQRHVALLEYPPYLALALDNIGVKLTSSRKITILDAHSLQYRGTVLRYVHRNGSVYSYEASVGWGIGKLQNGQVQAYAFGISLGVLVILLSYLIWG